MKLMSDIDVDKLFETMKAKFVKGKVEEPIVFYFSLGDTEKWTLTIEPDDIHIQKGKVDNADCFLKTEKDLFIKMIRGEWKPGVMDFMSGKVKSNDPFKLQILQDVFGG
jgi:long-chain acyl-CoA synthetase